MDRWRRLRDRLAVGTDRVRLSWGDLEDLVGALPDSATRYRAWWSGDRPQVRTWREAGFALGTLAPGEFVEFVRTGEAPVPPAHTDLAPASGLPAPPPGDADLLLVSCVKKKLTRPAAAKDLYISSLFTKQRRYAEDRAVPWFILSAQNGLVAPEEQLDPYELYLPDTPASYRASWAASVVDRLELLAGPLDGVTVEIHAGRMYLDPMVGRLRGRGAVIVDPLAGLTMGQRLSWYDTRARRRVTAASPKAPPDTVESLVSRLLDRSAGESPAAFLARGRVGRDDPGLYSWWIDPDGAADLTTGLDLVVDDGLIYAGLAGATRWPSGRRSTNTLWSRVAGMHLGGQQSFSTLRRTLASVLANTWEGRIVEEDALTRWMGSHLVVVIAPTTDADALGRLEKDVLTAIDPPLNLQGMPPTPLRRRLKELRRRNQE